MQAKYFFQLGNAELRQIDDSLATAQKNHPSLSDYWIYVPFDLTGRVAAGSRGKSQAERFEEWKIAVESAARASGSSLSVTLCTAAAIRGQIHKADPHGGMRRYWFDESVLTKTQIQQCLDDAIAFAGPRYTAALDVVTSAHVGLDFFGGIGDFAAWREEALLPVIAQLRSLMGWGDEALGILGELDANIARAALRRLIEACDRMTDVTSVASDSVEVKQGLAIVLPLLERARVAQELAFYAKHGRDKDTPSFRQFHAEYMCDFPAGEMDAAREWEQAARALEAALTSSEIGAATTRSLLLVGPAGIGKTHSIVSAARRRFERGGYSLVVFGDDFGRGEPWEVIRSKFGFGADIARRELFECLQACADSTGLPFVFYIDALNESPRDARWKSKLPELLAQCAPYPSLKICVSTRDTYRDLVVDARFPGYAFEHLGFAGQEFEAVEAFATYYGLDAEITPLFSPELGNPLFLHLACRTVRDECRTSLDVSLSGFAALLDGHLKHCDSLVRSRLAFTNPKNLVRAAMLRLSELLTSNLPKERTWEACTGELSAIVGTEFPAESLLKELEHEGLVILSAGDHDTWFVRLGYQRYGDILRASGIVERLTGPQGLDFSSLASQLAAITPEDEGVLEALAAVLPEQVGVEITDASLGVEPALAHKLLVRAMVWRSRDSVRYEIDSHVYRALHTPGLWREVYDMFFRVSLVPGHRLNASNWLSPFLRRSLLVDRDAFLSVAAFKSFDDNGAVWSLINAALKANVLRWPAESRELAAVVLAWLTSVADRRVRDLSAKAMTRLLESQPGLGRVLTIEFQGCDDDYILESIAQAIYSACLLQRHRAGEFIPALTGLLSPTFDSPNVLVRDSVRLLGQLIGRDKLNASMLKQLDAFPSKASTCTSWPTLPDAKPLLDLERLPPNMELWGSSMPPDFWRYQVESKIRDFDLNSAGISRENIASWLMVEVLALGYPGTNQCALKMDRAISGEFGDGRGRKGYADRLGKKYYWTLLHRLLGVLADNVSTKTSHSGWKAGPAHFWSVDVRKSDLTDVRDISPPRDYPDEVIQGPRYCFPQRTENVKQWVRTDDFTQHGDCIVRKSNAGTEWVALSLSARDSDQPPGDPSWTESHLGVEVVYTSLFVTGRLPAFGPSSLGRDAFESQGALWYRGYLAEYPDGPVFEQAADEGDFYRGPCGMDFAEVGLLRGGEWEYDYSYTTPERPGSINVPCQDLVKRLGLAWDRQRGWLDGNGQLIAFETRAKRRDGLFVRRDALNGYLATTQRTLVYRRFANRGLFSQGGRDGSQIDLFSWMIYHPTDMPRVLNETKRPFNC
ncbi:ATP-binding protein [Achromobacter spanius]|uniref:ATP-binding protein n=1 Tax=Achromobacter spanius TaxID=217203 RepID=UPI00380375EA